MGLFLGSKNVGYIHEDADLDQALKDCILAAYIHSGQYFSCISRLIVHDSIADQFLERFVEMSKAIK